MKNNDPYGIKASKEKENAKIQREEMNQEAFNELVKEIKNIGEKLGKIEENMNHKVK